MARQLRIEFGGAFYHITSRGNLRENIFYDNKDKTRFLEILKRTKDRYGYLLHAYTLMDNHYHLLIETPKANISQMGKLGSNLQKSFDKMLPLGIIAAYGKAIKDRVRRRFLSHNIKRKSQRKHFL